MSFEDLIPVKRDGISHSETEVRHIVASFTNGEVPDYQMSAWLMAVVLKGMTLEETVWMTDAMVCSGRVLDLSAVTGVKVDKHSTGGVADTTTLVVAPLVAACGVPVAKMSGRGLGHTGGTLDKLESIPGFRIELTEEEFVRQVCDVGVAVIAQSEDVDPADKRIYALRDVTGTVGSIPLIVSSILSKKIAGGADAILLDVKVGSGAFMKTIEDARALSRALEQTGAALGRSVECVLTDMSQPLGRFVGNASEVAEAIAVLRGNGGLALTELSVRLATRMVVMGGGADDAVAARRMVQHALDAGAGIDKLREWMCAQGGDGRVVDDPAMLPSSPLQRTLFSVQDGSVAGIDTELIGLCAADTGAGRECINDRIDPAAGVEVLVRIGDRVSQGSPLAILHAAEESRLDRAEARLRGAFVFADEAVSPPQLFLED